MPPVAFSLEPLKHLARQHRPGSEFHCEEMPGGASLRRFFRVRYADTAGAVGMFVPDASKPEEVTQSADAAEDKWPFVEVLELLEQRGVFVPRLLGSDTASGWLLVQDLGDTTLAEALSASPQRKGELYRQAVCDLADAQRALRELPHGSVVGRRRFDRQLLSWELEHFYEYGLLARGLALEPAARDTFVQATQDLVSLILQQPYGFTHRDYQSRNLMVIDTPNQAPRLAWVDFQDALLGPRVYDLVALLNDSYQQFDDAFVEARLADYAQRSDLPDSAAEELRREFDLVTVQRKLKDAGRFVFIERKKGDPSYLDFVAPTLLKVRGALLRTRELSPLRDLYDVLAGPLGWN